MNEIVLEIPEELKVMVPTLREVVDEAMNQVERGRLGGAAKYASFEETIGEKLREVERRAHEAALAALDVTAPKVTINNVLHTRVLENDEFTKAPFDTKEYVVRRLIDFWHAVEKLAPAAKVIAGDDGSKPLLARWRLLLGNSSSASRKILAELVASGMEDVVDNGTSKPVHEAITYFTNNAKRMNYAAARRRGLPIGSGNVEATCKGDVPARVDHSSGGLDGWSIVRRLRPLRQSGLFVQRAS